MMNTLRGQYTICFISEGKTLAIIIQNEKYLLLARHGRDLQFMFGPMWVENMSEFDPK